MTPDEILRTGLLLLVAGASWRCIYLLLSDWERISPPYWRWIIATFHVVLGANAFAIATALTLNREITLATWTLLGSYALLVGVAILAPRGHR